MTNQVDRELFASFLEEVSGYMPEVESALECYFADCSRTDCLEQAHRLMHTISGASAMLGLTELSAAARRVEDKLEEFAAGARASDTSLADEMLNDFVFVAEQLTALAAEHAAADTKDAAENAPADFDWLAKDSDREGGGEHYDLPALELTMPEAFAVPDFNGDVLAGEIGEPQLDEAVLRAAVRFDAPSADAQIASDEVPPQFVSPLFDEQAPFDSPVRLDEQPPSVAPPSVDAAEAIDPEMLEVFQEEAEEHLRAMSAGLTTLVSEPDNRPALQEVRRSTHTLKGAAGVVGLRTAARVAHRMEDLLDKLYENQAAVERGALNLLLRSTDVIEHLARGATPDKFHTLLAELHAQYDSLLAAPGAPDPAPREAESVDDVLIDDALPAFVPDAPHSGVTLEPRAQETGARSSAGAEARGGNLLKTPIKNSEAEHQAAGGRARVRRVVRVPLERLDSVIKLVGELVISRAALENYAADLLRENRELRHSTERLRRVSMKLEAEYEANLLRSGAERIVQFTGADMGNAGDTDPFNVAGRTRLQLAALTGAPVAAALPASHSPTTSHDVTTAGEQTHGFDELEFDRYTEFHRLSRELAEASTDTAAVHNELGVLHGNFESVLLRQRRLTNDIQERLMRVRMVPLQTLAARLERTVRVAADAEGKQARLLLEGAGVELDTTVLDQIADPLLHILRNAVSHGIEREEVRRALGKPEQGTIRLRAAYEGSQVVIDVEDDGGGINAAAVCARAVEANFITAEKSARMTEKDALALVFLPGLSTARRVSEISGRGVGMDVVRDTVERLQGTLDLQSTPGAGTRLTLRLPLTLAVTRAFIVRARSATYAIPTSAVRRVVHADEKMLGAMRGEGVLQSEGETYPVVSLAEWLRLTESAFGADVNQAPVLVLRAAGKTAALVVDEIAEAREVVVKLLGADLRRMHGVMGATVTGDGRVIPILNPDDIVRGGRASSSAVLVSSPRAEESAPAPRHDARRRVMIVDDSPSVRRVMINLLKANGWTPAPAKDGLDALEILHNSGADGLPSVILLDVEMPRMNGYELLATLRQQETMRHIPVVMITSRGGEKHRQKALGLGASDYLTKPYQDDVLLASIARLSALSAPQPPA